MPRRSPRSSRPPPAERRTLEIFAGGSKRAFGRPVRAEQSLDLSGIAGVVNYEPRELVLTARPSTPLAEIEAALREQGQMLAFEPPRWLDLLGGGGTPTLGGVLACNLSGPRRVRAGAARDFILGFSAVNGRGEVFKAGGKVVKNVTGFDLSKLMAGSFGTLAVLTEVTLKVMPRPETECTILLPGFERGQGAGCDGAGAQFAARGCLRRASSGIFRAALLCRRAGGCHGAASGGSRAFGRVSRGGDRKPVWRRRATGGRDLRAVLGRGRRGARAVAAGLAAGLAAVPDAEFVRWFGGVDPDTFAGRRGFVRLGRRPGLAEPRRGGGRRRRRRRCGSRRVERVRARHPRGRAGSLARGAWRCSSRRSPRSPRWRRG